MDDVTRYKHSEAQVSERIRHFANQENQEDLRSELAVARLLCEDSLQSGSIAQTDRILNTIGKLAQSQVAIKKMKSEYLDKNTVYRLATKLVEIVIRAVRDKFSGWESVVDAMANEITAAVKTADNETLEAK